MALSSTRVIGTCAVIGQAAGTGAALAVPARLPSRGCGGAGCIRELQQALLEDGCFIPGMNRQSTGRVSARLSAGENAILQDGWERPHDGCGHAVAFPGGRRTDR